MPRKTARRINATCIMCQRYDGPVTASSAAGCVCCLEDSFFVGQPASSLEFGCGIDWVQLPDSHSYYCDQQPLCYCKILTSARIKHCSDEYFITRRIQKILQSEPRLPSTRSSSTHKHWYLQSIPMPQREMCWMTWLQWFKRKKGLLTTSDLHDVWRL